MSEVIFEKPFGVHIFGKRHNICVCFFDANGAVIQAGTLEVKNLTNQQELTNTVMSVWNPNAVRCCIILGVNDGEVKIGDIKRQMKPIVVT